MRKIKFRAWHKPTQLMDDVALIDFYNEEIGILYVTPVTQRKSMQRFDFNEMELMQYTGLKDKNGVEIYEGDIVKTDNGSYSYVVAYDHAWFYPLHIIKTEYLQVIGNIYENEELLDE